MNNPNDITLIFIQYAQNNCAVMIHKWLIYFFNASINKLEDR